MKVILGTLKDKGDDLAEFLDPRVGAKPSLSGGEIEIEDGQMREGVKPRHVKTYIKRFLYMKGVRKNYRVFVNGKELTVQEIELGEKAEEEAEEKKPEKATEEAPPKDEPAAEAAAEAPAEEEAPEEKPKPKKAAKKPKAKKKSEED